MKFSTISIWLTCGMICLVSFFYYPKWNKSTTEATISWDVSGYYWYLPAFLIYKDVKEISFSDQILQNYRPTPALLQAYKAPNGNYVFKYSCGQAILMFPAFVVADILAPVFGFPADGFSIPYQFAIFLWGLIISLLGLILLKKILISYFSEMAAGLTILCIAIGTNYLEYGAITNAMTHNYLFTLYALLLWITMKFYKQPTFLKAIGLGATVGFMALTRPTEILAVMIPLAFGVSLQFKSITSRILFIIKEYEKLAITACIVLLIGSLQLFYWKFVSGSWLVYSYEDQGFSWLHPHIIDGLFSGRAGWLVYSPIMLLAVIGMVPLYRKHPTLAPVIILFSIIFAYVTFAWDIWWYGGSVGQRAMVQIYPVLAFPMAALFDVFHKVNWKVIPVTIFSLLSIHYSIWVVHQAHYGGMLVAGDMTSEYLKAILLKNNMPDGARKLLDTRKIYYDEIKDSTVLLNAVDTSNNLKYICLNDTLQFSPAKRYPLPATQGWLRASGDFYTNHKEWDTWKMTQLVLKYYKKGEYLRSDVLRAQRHMDNGKLYHLYLDSKLRYEPDEVEIFLWNSDGQSTICVDNIHLIYHRGK